VLLEMVPRSRRVPKNAGRSPAADGRTVDLSVLPSVGDTAVVLAGSAWLLMHASAHSSAVVNLFILP
jgi:hypothetical protein